MPPALHLLKTVCVCVCVGGGGGEGGSSRENQCKIVDKSAERVEHPVLNPH